MTGWELRAAAPSWEALPAFGPDGLGSDELDFRFFLLFFFFGLTALPSSGVGASVELLLLLKPRVAPESRWYTPA